MSERPRALIKARRVLIEARRARMEDYAELRSWGLTRRQAADRLGVTVRTTHRYDRHLEQEEGET